MFRKDRDDLEEEQQEDVVELIDDDDIEVVHVRRMGLVGFLGGMIVGGLVGAGVALLVAPERGEIVRRRIRRKLEDASDDAIDRFEDIRDDAGRRFRKGRRQLRRMRDRVTD